MGHELHRDSRLVIYTVDADARPVVAQDTVDISLDRLSDADFKKAQALIEDIRHPGALKASYRELVNNDSEDNRGYAVRLGNNNAADSYLSRRRLLGPGGGRQARQPCPPGRRTARAENLKTFLLQNHRAIMRAK